MIPIVSLWLPILVSAVVVFIASSIVHMALGYHRRDWQRVPAEEEVMASLRQYQIPPGDYLMPYPYPPAVANSPEFKARAEQGPRATFTVIPSEPQSMVKSLVLWFLYSMVVALFAGYVAGVVLAQGTGFMLVFRITSTVAFAGFALAHWQETIWYSRNLGTTLRNTLDALIYSLLIGGVFGWLWP